MTASDLARKISKRLDVPLKDGKVVVETIFSALAGECLSSPRVELRGFGTFSAVRRRARPARNFRTGEPMTAPERLTLKFKPGKILLEKLRA